MRDIPFFNTENGIASLRLKEIPYFQTAYITIQSALDEEKLLLDCIGLCRAAGAEKIYATGLEKELGCDNVVTVIKMTRDVTLNAEVDAMLFPVQEKTLPLWREIYNKKMRNVTGAAYMNDAMAIEMLAERKAYFVHKDEELIGIGTACGNEISAVASLKNGAGQDVVCALLGALSEDTVAIEVASDNQKAMALYSALGFVETGIVTSWYKIFDDVK